MARVLCPMSRKCLSRGRRKQLCSAWLPRLFPIFSPPFPPASLPQLPHYFPLSGAGPIRLSDFPALPQHGTLGPGLLFAARHLGFAVAFFMAPDIEVRGGLRGMAWFCKNGVITPEYRNYYRGPWLELPIDMAHVCPMCTTQVETWILPSCWAAEYQLPSSHAGDHHLAGGVG